MIDSRWLVISREADSPLAVHEAWHDKAASAASPRQALAGLVQRISTRPMAGPARSKGTPDLARIKQRFALELQEAAEAKLFDSSFLSATRRLCASDMRDTDAFGAHLLGLRLNAADVLDRLRPGRRVVLHLTCRDRMERADASVASFAPAAQVDASHVKVVGGGFESPYAWEAPEGVLVVPAPDSYEHLPLKVLLAIQLLALLPSVSAILKVDDDHRLLDAGALEREFRRCESLPTPILIGRLIRNRFVGDHNRVWHFGKCEDPQLNRAPYGLPGPRQWVDGSYGYITNRRAMRALSIGLTYFMPYVGISLYEDVACSYLLQELGGSVRDRAMGTILNAVNEY
jgi:hypothetical protein